MVLLSAVALGLIVGIISGGRFGGFAAAASRFRYLPVIVAAAVIQFIIITPPVGDTDFIHSAGPYIHVVTVIATLVVMWMNFHIPGMKIILAGAILNALAIVANGGFMPASESAIRQSGQYEYYALSEEERAAGERLTFSHAKMVDDGTSLLLFDPDTPLLILGDIIPIPERYPLASAFSIGDILIALGAAIAVARVMHLPESKDIEAEGHSPVEHAAS